MGCDIHLHTEIKINGQWHSYGTPNGGRWYALFEKMAGVRGDESNAIALPRGIPEDISEIVKVSHERWRGDAHSASYLDADEIKILEVWYRDQIKASPPEEYDYPEKYWGYLFGNSWGGWVDHCDDYPMGIEDIRFVFWFDN